MKRASVGVALVLLVAAAAGCDDYGNTAGIVAADRTGALITPVPRGRPDAPLVAQCGRGGISAAGAAEIVREPYLQRLGPDGVTLMWTSKVTSTEGLRVEVTGPDGSVVATVPVRIDASARPKGAIQVGARIEGLLPASTWCWSIRRGDALLAGPNGFRTAPPVGSTGDVSFLVFGDGGSGTDDQAAVVRQMQEFPYDFMLILGDVAYENGTLEEFERNVFDVYAPLFRSFATFPISGNHEYGTFDAEPFREVFELPENGGEAGRERWYSFDWGPIHFVALDTEQVGAAQQAWLEADLAATTQPWKVVYLHKPPYSSGEHGSDMAVRDRFVPVFARHGVQLVLAGHDHNYERTLPLDGITYFVSGGGGRGTRNVGASDFTAFSVEVLHFLLVRTQGNRLMVHAIDATGREFDGVEIVR